MKKAKQISTILMLSGIWIIFLVWEIYVTEWSILNDKNIIRIDLLIILPIIQLITISTLIKAFNNNKI